ncbi:MAG TPA: DUF6600 domain-containing protein [Candidatus Acidoferrales bacterium]|nr:DUF6600 domain-containing protein [Candidatus Acidoferrales bacterium]
MRRSLVSRFALPSFAILMIFALMNVPRAVRASDLSYARIVRLSVVTGDVQVSRPAHPAWEAASVNMPVMQGMAIGTNDGFAEVQFEDGTTAWIAPNTLVQFTELALADGGRITKLTLGQGTMSVLTELRKGDAFSLASGDETITTPKNALFRIDAFHDGASVSVLGGQAEVASATGTMQVPKGKTFAFRSKSKDQAQENTGLRANPKMDSWDKFVVARAEQTQTEAAQSASYVNAPFSYGMADLSQYGNWSYFPGQGYGWQPMGMGNCWMPFMNGGWDFMPGFGWSWVSSEPWGWMPYHFGNWDYLPSNGWTWFPSGFDAWDPAPVNWYSAGNQVGWWPASGAGFGGSSPLMFEQIASGCPGFNGMGFGAVPNNFASGAEGSGPRTPAKKGTAPTGKMPTPPRLVLTTNRLGGGGNVRLRASTSEGKNAAFAASEPLENGKASTMFESRVGVRGGINASAPGRMFAPTVGSVAALRTSIAGRAGTMPARAGMTAMPSNSRMATMPMRENLRAVNAMAAPPSMPRRPAPMAFSRMNAGGQTGANAGFSRGGSSAGYSGGSSSSFRGSAASAGTRPSMPSAPAAAPRASAPASAGRPH